MTADYNLGICVNNNDPKKLGRIRVLPLNVLGNFVTLAQILKFIEQEDTTAESSKLYKPWYITKFENYSGQDKYLCEPFLPKHISITPNPGQLVKIIKFDNNSLAQEFIGPFTIDQVTLTEEFRNVINNLNKNVNLSEALPKNNKTFLSGYNSEQLILGDNEVLMRLSHINNDKTRKNTYPFTQLSQFNNSYKLTNKSVTTTTIKDVPIDHICQLFLTYQPNKISGTLLLFDASTIINEEGKIGLTKQTYSYKKPYITESSGGFKVKHTITCANITDFSSILGSILSSYDAGKTIKYYNVNGTPIVQTTEDNKSTILVNNNVANMHNIGGGNDPTLSNIVDGLKNWVFRLTPNTVATIGTVPDDVTSFISLYKTDKLYGTLKLSDTTVATNNQLVPELIDNKQSAYCAYADKILFVSSLNTPGMVGDKNFDGVGASKISELISANNTYGLLRGEKLLSLIVEILQLFKAHNHKSLSSESESLSDPSVSAIADLIKKVLNEQKESSNNVVINHNIRIN